MTSFDTYSVDGRYTGYDDPYAAFSTDTPPYSADTYTYGDSEEVTVDHVNIPDPFGSNPEPFVPSGPVPISNGNGKSPYDIGEDSEAISSSDGPVLPPPNEMKEEGFALREWRRRTLRMIFEDMMSTVRPIKIYEKGHHPNYQCLSYANNYHLKDDSISKENKGALESGGYMHRVGPSYWGQFSHSQSTIG